MPERSVSIFSNRMYQPQTTEVGPVAIDDDITHIAVWFDRVDWDETHPSPLISIIVSKSYDGGSTWRTGGTSGTHGGILISDNGFAYPYTKWISRVFPGTGRMVKATVTIHRSTRLKAEIDFLIR